MNETTFTLDITNPFNPLTVISELTYLSYRYNRLLSPEIPYKSWDKIFSNVELLEIKLMKEIFG